jgi:transcriptional regulator with XRE-family HTH domain
VDPSKRLLKRFGLIVRRHRDRLGIPQEELAHRARLHRTYISLVERGLRNPTLEVIQALARALETTMTAMISELERGG